MRRRRLTIAVIAVAAAIAALPAAAAEAGPKKKFNFGSRTLRTGMAGKDVRVLQKSLNSLAITTPVTGRFRPVTRKAVKKLEKRQRWAVNGIVTKKEAKRIRRLLARGHGSVFFVFGGYYPVVNVTAARRGEAEVEVLDVATATVVATIPLSFDAPKQLPVAWNELVSAGGWAPDATYQMRISAPGTAAATITGGQTQPFLVRGRAFPVPGKHDFGGAGSRFGAPRSGHIHQGQDVAASCGEPMLAAEGGTVTVKAYQAGGAGHYLVIRGAISATDYVFMHMQSPSPLVEGQVIHTGSQIGLVGNTGSSSGCHLHFEHWTYPGWFAGGAPYDPLPELAYWDTYS
jgi:murein DD-endopeptidase MepM/ murein hydrolase activator NlpD